ncbi:MAG: ROK family protein [Sciscionella sp.]
MTSPQFVLGIDIGGTKTALACATLDGTLLCSERIPTGAAHGADHVIGRILANARALLARTEGDLVGVGAATPGVVREDRILLAPNNPGWDTVALAPLLRAELGVARVVVDNDVKVAALAEARLGALTDVSHGIFLNLGTGLAAAAVIEGTVLRGAHGAATEIAYQVMDGITARTGRAPLEERVSGAGIARRASELLGRTVTTRQALALAEHNTALGVLVDDAFDTLSAHLANLAITLDPQRIAVGGGMASYHARLFPRLAAALQATVPFPPELVLARFTQDGALTGALLLAAEAS